MCSRIQLCSRRRVRCVTRRFYLSKRCRGGTLDDPLCLRPRGPKLRARNENLQRTLSRQPRTAPWWPPRGATASRGGGKADNQRHGTAERARRQDGGRRWRRRRRPGVGRPSGGAGSLGDRAASASRPRSPSCSRGSGSRSCASQLELRGTHAMSGCACEHGCAATDEARERAPRLRESLAASEPAWWVALRRAGRLWQRRGGPLEVI